jgi:hypothetical protein
LLSAEESDLLTRVDPGTPWGELMHQYWIPTVRSDELREAFKQTVEAPGR